MLLCSEHIYYDVRVLHHFFTYTYPISTIMKSSTFQPLLRYAPGWATNP